MLKLSLKEGEYVNIGDNIRVVYAGGSGKNGRLMIDAPREMNISRSNNDPNPEKRKDTYYPCLLYTSPSPRDTERSRMPSSA